MFGEAGGIGTSLCDTMARSQRNSLSNFEEPNGDGMNRIVPATWLVIVALACLSLQATADEKLDVLTVGPDGVAPRKQLEFALKREFDRQVERRSEAFEKALKSESACRAWQSERRAFLLERIGGLPERTPLNAAVVGSLPGKGYRIEKILLETRPGFHLTANLYLPTDTPAPWPAVLIPCGHSHNGKASGQYQRACMLLARNGMAAICYDPIGQGERYQMLDATMERKSFLDAEHVPTPHPNVRYMCTTEHTMVGLSSTLLGANVAQFRVWDGMRVIDYLQSRPDIKADKIGCAGNSGGGTETAYLMALDDRIVAASPGCYLTTFRRLIEAKGAQDGEQNIFGQIAFGLDEADYCIIRAPKPTLICAATRDATFDFRGTWELFLEAKRFYSRIGAAERVDINASDAPHGFTIQQREATARFMHRWLIGGDKPIRELEQLPDAVTDKQLWDLSEPEWTAAQLQCSPQGQVLLMPGERSAFQINAETATRLKSQRTEKWNKLDDDERRRMVCERIGARRPVDIPAAKVTTAGDVARDNCTVRKLILERDDGIRIPALAYLPKQPSGVATLYIHGTSMQDDAGRGGPIDRLVDQGQIVIAAELCGIGETETGHDKPDFGRGRFGRDNLQIFVSYLTGRSFVGLRTEDVHRWTKALRDPKLLGTPIKELHLVAVGEAGISALHAAALEPAAFKAVTIRRMIPSWESVVGATETFDQWVNIVHGALRDYDLADLRSLAGGERITITEPVDVMGKPLP